MSTENWTTFYVFKDTSDGDRPPQLLRFQAKGWGNGLKTKQRLNALSYSTVISDPGAAGVSVTPQGALDHFRLQKLNTIAHLKDELEKAEKEFAALPRVITDAEAVEEKS